MTPEEILSRDLGEIAALIRDGAVDSRTVTATVLEALEERGRALGAVARLWPERAMAEAEACDRERAAGRLRGPLHGVPLVHKDMFYRAGELTECGSRLFAGFRPTVTATVLERLDAAGAIDAGRT
ncbi:MAG TPA: Asp-tRNA(Asn)/Glu-tRNA(Gln) amidotransferase GatCAB subunit A, partial [Rhodospirillales bacterium]|nr:Asp-tRNA(Asn)/Glu-tRNA(Gln) amidotransferase GatCAB subunit A [Rhodospirillales bacterium]